jgi:hypothetical protein
MNETISIPEKLGRWALAWGIAAALSAYPPQVLIFFWLFPVGMFEFLLPPNDYQRSISFNISSLLIIGWIIYGLLTIIAFCQNQRSHFRIVFMILCVLLAMNVAGCYHGRTKLHFE